MRAGAMVCFCDLPLSLIGKHREEYGKFAIGLRKDWGLKNGVAPVIYTHSKAQTRPPVLRLTVKAPASHDKTLANDDLDILAAYTKPFRGPGWRSQRYQPRVRFYDEREWRYCTNCSERKALVHRLGDLPRGSQREPNFTAASKRRTRYQSPRTIFNI